MLRQLCIQGQTQIAPSRHFEIDVKGFLSRLANFQRAWPHLMSKDKTGKGEDHQKGDNQT